jgi:hypothetical protein
METIIVYLDDAGHAAQALVSMTNPAAPARQVVPRHWILVACAPRMTHRISKWVSHRTRENWRERWADKLFEQVLPLLQRREGDRITPVLARVPLPELTRSLQGEFGPASVVDVRRPKSVGEQPANDGREPDAPGRPGPGPLLGLGAALLLACD